MDVAEHTVKTAVPWISELAGILGEDAVSVNSPDLEEHAIDKWYASHPPEAVVFAKSRAQVEATLRFAAERNIPVTTRGAGVGYVGGCVPVSGGIVLSVRGMDRILEVNPDARLVARKPSRDLL